MGFFDEVITWVDGAASPVFEFVLKYWLWALAVGVGLIVWFFMEVL